MITGFRRRFRPLFVIWLAFMWVMLQGEISVGNIVAGIALGFAVVLILPLPAIPVTNLKVNWRQLLRLLVVWVWQLFTASAKVSWLALRRQPPPKTAILKVPMRVSSEFVLFFATVLYNLQPGGSVTDIDIANRMWTIHILDAGSAEAIDSELGHVQQLERQLIHTFEGV